MDIIELKKEQRKLATRVELQDKHSSITTMGGVECVSIGTKLFAVVVVCDAKTFEVLEMQSYLLPDPLPHRPGFEAYREMPAIIEACNKLEQEPDVLLVKGHGILHPRRLGIASHVGLALSIPTIGVGAKLPCGEVENGKIQYHDEVAGFEITTREHANPIYVSPGHLITRGNVLRLIPSTIRPPHKMPEPLHLAHKIAKKKVKELKE